MRFTCVCCGNSDLICLGKIPSAINFAGRLLDSPLQGGNLFRCRSCRLVFRYPRLSKIKLDELYCQGNENVWRSFFHLRKDWQISKHWISKYMPTSKSILDVGCSDGEFLHSHSNSHKLYGIEINPVRSEEAKKKGVQVMRYNKKLCLG